MPIYTLASRSPRISASAWIAPNATVIGSVTLHEHSSIWWNCVLRSDTETITIGENTNVQDGSILHADPGAPLTLGNHVSVGHMAMLHGCTVGDGSLIGIKSVILNHTVIGKECLIGANTLIAEGKTIPDRSLVLGSPGRVVRTLTDDEVANLRRIAAHYVANAQRYRDELQIMNT
ncbi:MAG TPA: gamma carbonic anhydrase family protein [Rhodocyclaceae bacterium]|jgi:carbonic anhydrase/acetyltransferase-like protein (isoleucine patch superfamily)|nr:gamma carbonic anhydrase family protein [Rhodocyclaceae bacterium]